MHAPMDGMVMDVLAESIQPGPPGTVKKVRESKNEPGKGNKRKVRNLITFH